MLLKGLFGPLEDEHLAITAPPWTPEEPPILTGINDVEIDLETTGLKWWAGDLPIGAGISYAGRTQYLSWGSRSGLPQHDEATCRRWFQEQVKFKRITNANIKFDYHMLHAWGVDLEAQGNVLSDIQHQAALLDDSRRQFAQEILCKEYLPDDQKVLIVGGEALDPSQFARYPPGTVAVRAEADVRQVRALRELFAPQLASQQLGQVLALENECIYAVTEMERNAVIIDVDKLHRWVTAAQREYEQCLWDIHKGTGLRFNPDSGDDWGKLFKYCGIVSREVTAKGKASFTSAVITGVMKTTDNEWVRKAHHASKLSDLLSKYLVKYAKTVGADRKLRFALHQLRSDEGGTVTGRFSSSGLTCGSESIGANIQQILSVEKQLATYGPDYIIRELIIPDDEHEEVISADAAAIEYRLFSHYAANPKILRAYEADPWTNFHKLVHGMILLFKPDLSYKGIKNINFMSIYGGGIVKLAEMMGHISASEAAELNADRDYKKRNQDPRLRPTLSVKAVYNQMLPEVGPLLKQTGELAATRGYVTTLLKRRSRFPDKKRLHKALNSIIQGSAGDLMKLKMVEVHKQAKRIGLTPRMTIHDQIVGDGTQQTAADLGELLNQQSIPLRVPILWEVKMGANWRLCDEAAPEAPPRGFGDKTRGDR